MFPRFIYRGDSDPENKRKIKTQYPGSAYGGLLTNLSAKGSGREIFSNPLVSTVNRHVGKGWDKTHYLSFSEDYTRAMFFAAGKSGKNLELTDEIHWDAFLIKLDFQKFSKYEELEAGVFCCLYPGNFVQGADTLPVEEQLLRQQSNKHCAGRISSILLIDVVSFLSAQAKTLEGDISQAIRYAQKDKEWLVLPLDSNQETPGELTSQLDDGCLDYNIMRYQLVS